MPDIAKASAAMHEENLSAWLFYSHHHRDPVADRFLEVSREAVNSRPWLYLLRSDGSAVKLVHAVEQKILDHLPGEKRIYSSREKLKQDLSQLAGNLQEVACQFSCELPALSFLDHGAAQLLESCGFRLCPASSLIQRVLGVLDRRAIESHCRAADKLYAVVEEVWKRLRREMRCEAPLWETTIQGWILDLFNETDLRTDSPPIVAAGVNSADPHYSPGLRSSDRGALLQSDSVLQLDLWAKERAEGSIYADISWVGILGTRIPAKVQRAFAAVVEARDRAVRLIDESLSSGRSISGQQVDSRVRAFLIDRGYGEYLKHRTGHGIDEDVHGLGVNLDSVEFPDPRLLVEGSCFSVEPGVYLSNFGVRTEIDVYIADAKAEVSGRQPQRELLAF